MTVVRLGFAEPPRAVSFLWRHFAEFRPHLSGYAVGIVVSWALTALIGTVARRAFGKDIDEIVWMWGVWWFAIEAVFCDVFGANGRTAIARRAIELSGPRTALEKEVGRFGCEACTYEWWVKFWHNTVRWSFAVRFAIKTALMVLPMYCMLSNQGNPLLTSKAMTSAFAILAWPLVGGWLNAWNLTGGLMVDDEMTLPQQVRLVLSNFWLFHSFGMSAFCLEWLPFLGQGFKATNAIGAGRLYMTVVHRSKWMDPGQPQHADSSGLSAPYRASPRCCHRRDWNMLAVLAYVAFLGVFVGVAIPFGKVIDTFLSGITSDAAEDIVAMGVVGVAPLLLSLVLVAHQRVFSARTVVPPSVEFSAPREYVLCTVLV